MSSAPIFRRILVWGALLAVAIAVVGSIAGGLLAGPEGVTSALIGAVASFVFTGLTAASILLAQRVTHGDLLNPAYLGIVMGGWLVKLVLFVVFVIALGGADWVDRLTLFLTIVVSVVGGLVIDLVVIARSRLGYVSDVTLPGPSDSDG